MAGEYKSVIINNIKSLLPIANESASALWYRLASLVSDIMDIITTETNNTIEIIENAALTKRVLNQQYYIDVALQYQYNTPLIIINEDTNQYGYASVNEDNQIIKQAAISIQNDTITLNVATTDSENNLEPLSQEQLQSFSTYYSNFTALGIPVVIKSTSPNIIQINTGSLISYQRDYNLSSIQDAVNSMLQTIQQNVILGASYYLNDIENELSKINGIINVYIPSVTVFENSSDEEGQQTSNKIELSAGYFNFSSNSANNIQYESI